MPYPMDKGWGTSGMLSDLKVFVVVKIEFMVFWVGALCGCCIPMFWRTILLPSSGLKHMANRM
jgi:uncharacterized membrane protein YagU involved in acid resistance